MPTPDNPWLLSTGGTAGPAYAARFAERTAAGDDLDGEARRVDRLLAERVLGRVPDHPPAHVSSHISSHVSSHISSHVPAHVPSHVPAHVPAGILDAGCGTGRVAIALAALGHRVVGVDLDASMLDEARRAAPQLDWRLGDLADLDLGRPVDAVVAAGNLWPLLTPGTHARVVARLAAHLRPGGLLIAGFGLDDTHVPFAMPPGYAFPDLAGWDAAAGAAGLVLRERSADWDGLEPYTGGGYVVSVHAREGTP